MQVETIISLKNVSKQFSMADGVLDVITNISLDIYKNELVCILGHSGCGKTTLLRMISALDTCSEGKILVEGNLHQEPNKDVLLLFQDFNQLFPWKTILQNIMHPLLATRVVKTKKEAKLVAENRLEEVGLLEFKNNFPYQLSGGMKQRAAFVRTLALQPKILLMDEAFASLDMVTKHSLQKLTRQECKKHRITAVFVSHDIEEAVHMADRIVIMHSNPGSIKEILNNPYVNSLDDKDKMMMMTRIISILV